MSGTARNGRPVIFGEVLFDSFPDGGDSLGGAPFNVAWNLQALGADPLFVGAVGDDALGERVRAAMRIAGLDASGLQSTSRAPTGRVQVHLEAGEPHYDILADQAYDHVDIERLQETLAAPVALLYHGSLALRGERSRAACGWLAQRAERRFVDVNLRAPWYQPDAVRERIRGADYVKLNQDEARELLPPGGAPAADPLAHAGITEALILTEGSRGASIRFRDGSTLAAPAPAVRNLRDPVGAGDAFASVVILGILQQWDWPLVLERALDFAARVCTLQGATTTDSSFYAAATAEWQKTP
jgi:fructokinase